MDSQRPVDLHSIRIYFLLFILVTGWLIHSAMKPERLPIGSPMPELNVLTQNGPLKIQPDSLSNTMIVYFNSNCKYCQYELNLFDGSLSKFVNTQIMLLTPEEDLFADGKIDSWPALTNSPEVLWGIVNEKKFGDDFGSKNFPTIFIFNKYGSLCAKLLGEAKLEKVLAELKKSWRSGTPG